MITKLAYNALIKEVELTPKPGLVDCANNGSHTDMTVETFYLSAKAISPFIAQFYNCGSNFNELREIGKKCEEEMFNSTKGVNTHKGMIFSLAVICGAIGSVGGECLQTLQDEIKYICKDLIQKDFQKILNPCTHGERYYLETNSKGIRGEAQSGYPTIFEISLPFFKQKLDEYGEEIALKLTLLLLMSITEDSTVYARGGVDGLLFVQSEAKKLLEVKDITLLESNLKEFDDMMIKKNLSSGGSADLLGITWFIFSLSKNHNT